MSPRIAAAALLLAPLTARANPAFSRPATLTTGEVLAIRAQQVLAMTVDEALGAAVSVVYDPETQHLVFVLSGPRSTTDDARASIETFRKTYLSRLIDHPPVKGVKLVEKDALIRYVNRQAQKIVLEWSDGVYVMK